MASMNAFPSDPAGELAAAELARQRLTGGLRLPTWFHTSLGVAVAVQIGAAAYGIAEQTGRGIAVAVAGCLPFVVVAWVQVTRFRRLNGVRVDGLVSRAVLGTSTWSVLAEMAGLAGAIWAALEDQPGLAAAAAVAGGAGYAASSYLWWRAYQRDPAGHARAESPATLLGYGLVAVAAFVLLVALR
jgi:hypothetical protein